MSNEKTEGVPSTLIDTLKTFLKMYEYGCRMLEGLAERHLAGEDIVPQINTLCSTAGTRAIFYLISISDESAEAVLHSDLFDIDERQKLSDIRLKYKPILEDVIDVGMAVVGGDMNPLSSAKLSLNYAQDEEAVRLDVRAYSGQRQIFRVAQDAIEFLGFVAHIIEEYSNYFELYQRQGLPLREHDIKELERLQKELQDSIAKLSKVSQKYLGSEKEEEATNE